MDAHRWLRWRHRRRPVSAAARMIASWDATVRLPVRAHLLWLAQQITEARTTAQAALDGPAAAQERLPQVLDLDLAPQLVADHMPSGARQLAEAVREARRAVRQLTTAPRSARRTLTRLVDDLERAEVLFARACNDVRGADLASADLTHLYLGGLRWDSATQWPAGWWDRVRAGSEPVDGGQQIRDY
ncbi:hypothetical protein [Streptomyces sp. NPDC051546]|uniref:hypothetical protein n=1 Tax=Streptomyces sp. NPDC051546 TaxID=3365655 RepID=UPI0037928439